MTFTLYQVNEYESVGSGKLAPDTYSKFKVEFPQFLVTKGRERLEFRIPRNSVELQMAEADLKKIGLRLYCKSQPHVIWMRDPSLIGAKVVHEFSPEDYDQAPFLTMDGAKQVGERKHLHFTSCVLVHLEHKIPPIGWAEGHGGLICTQTIKAAMKVAGFKGLTFAPVTVEGPRQPPEPLWEIWSDALMPPMSCPLVDDDGNPVQAGNYSNGCYTAETESPYLFVYTPEAIASMKGVDAAITHEDFGPKTKLCEMRRLLVSQRFRQWALEQKLELAYVPVIVRPAGVLSTKISYE